MNMGRLSYFTIMIIYKKDDQWFDIFYSSFTKYLRKMIAKDL